MWGSREDSRVVGEGNAQELTSSPSLLGDAGGTPLTLDRDWRPLAFSGSGAVEPAGLMFAGYGILAPGEGAFAAYDSYQGLDVTDKWVLVFRYLPTDTTSFYLACIPVLTVFTSAHADYNTPRDTAAALNYPGLQRIGKLMALMTRGLAMRAEAPDHIAQTKPKTGASRANLRAYLGTIPDYTASDIRGVLVNGVAKQGPAEQGGLRAGDIVVTVAGRAIENIYDYTYALNALKVGQPVEVGVRRDGQPLELTVTPASRD